MVDRIEILDTTLRDGEQKLPRLTELNIVLLSCRLRMEVLDPV